MLGAAGPLPEPPIGQDTRHPQLDCSSRPTGPTLTERADIRELVGLALEFLRGMQLSSGLFCFERGRGDARPRGRSLRYTLMTYLGLARAAAAGYEHGFDLAGIHRAAHAEVGSTELRPGDLGLYLWADARADGDRGPELAERLERALAAEGGLPAREGMELAWIVQGLALQRARGEDAGFARPLADALGALLANQTASGLLQHLGAPGVRRRFPNFATEIYGVLALATVGRLGFDERALPAARRVADRLLALQLPDGGWPWLYDAEIGGIVERYEIYSVHQHAMAPMGLLELAEAAGEPRYAEAAGKGLAWIHGANELGLRMVDEREGLIYRSIRRRRPWDRLLLYASTGSSRLLGRPLAGAARRPELNATCRPYELGWLCEAWAGRETALGAGSSNQR
jgi:hypothetical protein